MMALLEERQAQLVNEEFCMRRHVNQIEADFLKQMKTREKKLHQLLKPEKGHKPENEQRPQWYENHG